VSGWATAKKKSSGNGGPPPSEAFAAPAGTLDVSTISTEDAAIGPRSKSDAEGALPDIGERLASLQERLFAQSTAGDRRSVLLLLQGTDTAGKDGVIRQVVGMADPGALRMASFKKPSQEELAHDFLWRIEKQVPPAGFVGVFNRSQYEDVLVVRVHDIVPRKVWSQRYPAINEFERRLAKTSVTMVKCFLHVSRKVQAERLLARLDGPTKYWKYNPGDVDERGYWDAYQEAYSGPEPVQHQRRPGTSSRRTASGTATERSPRCSPRPWKPSTPSTRLRRSTSRRNAGGSRTAETRLHATLLGFAKRPLGSGCGAPPVCGAPAGPRCCRKRPALRSQ